MGVIFENLATLLLLLEMNRSTHGPVGVDFDVDMTSPKSWGDSVLMTRRKSTHLHMLQRRCLQLSMFVQFSILINSDWLIWWLSSAFNSSKVEQSRAKSRNLEASWSSLRCFFINLVDIVNEMPLIDWKWSSWLRFDMKLVYEQHQSGWMDPVGSNGLKLRETGKKS